MDIVIVGAGGHGKVVLEIVRAQHQHRVVGFLDADTSLIGSDVLGVSVIGGVNQIARLRQQKIRGAIVAIGDSRVRLSYAALLSEHGVELPSAIHPAASVSPSATIGRNTIVAAGAMICADATIGDSVICNTGCVIDHESEVEDGAHICPGALLAGRVRVGVGAFVGLGAKVLPCINIGRHAIVGAGTVVLADVQDEATAVGVPARVIHVSVVSRAG